MNEIDFGELKNDTNLVSRVQNVQDALEKINQHIDKMLELKIEQLTPAEKVEYDISMVYAINSLYFMHLKIIGDNSQIVSNSKFIQLPKIFLKTLNQFQNDVKHELNRVKQIMGRQKEVEDRKLRPVVEAAAAKRFVKSALYDVQQKNEDFRRKRGGGREMQQSKIYIGENPNPVNRKRKFDD